MHADGYNVVRVFLNGCCLDFWAIHLEMCPRLRPNLVDFLNKAKSNNLYVMITTDGPPAQGDYIHLLDTTWSDDLQAIVLHSSDRSACAERNSGKT
jgi:hypothetical protein